jgi:hypothetical protein
MSDPTYFHGPGLGRLGIPSVGERPFVASSFLLFRYRTLKQKVNRLDARASSLLKPRLINNGKVSFLHFFPLADDIACEDRKETDQHLSGTPDSMIASQRTETEAGLEISTMAAGTKNQLS